MLVGSFDELRDAKEKGAAVDVVDPKGDARLSSGRGHQGAEIQFTMAGFYDIRRPNGRNELVAVNADRHERDLTPAPPETLTLWQNTANGTANGENGADDDAEAAFALVVRNAGRVGAGGCRVVVGKSTSFGGQRGGMKPLDRLSEYLGAIERRLRLLALTRGAAVTAAAALALTVVAVLVGQPVRLLAGSVMGARVFLFLGLAFAIAAALIVPVIRLNRRRAAREAEATLSAVRGAPAHLHRTFGDNPSDPFLQLLAADTLAGGPAGRAAAVAKNARDLRLLLGRRGIAIGAALAGTSGPGFLGYGTSLLWGGMPKGVTKPFYAISVDPGNKTVRKRADQVITAHLLGFTAPKVQFFAKYASASKWEAGGDAHGTGRQRLSVPDRRRAGTLEYYVEAGGVQFAKPTS